MKRKRLTFFFFFKLHSRLLRELSKAFEKLLIFVIQTAENIFHLFICIFTIRKNNFSFNYEFCSEWVQQHEEKLRKK